MGDAFHFGGAYALSAKHKAGREERRKKLRDLMERYEEGCGVKDPSGKNRLKGETIPKVWKAKRMTAAKERLSFLAGAICGLWWLTRGM